MLLHGISKTCCYTTPLKACCYMAPLKARCYTTLLLSPMLDGNIFTKSHKTQILFWHIFTKAKYYFGNYLKSPNTILAHIYKAQNYFLAKTYFHILKSLTHRKYKITHLSKILLLQNLWELCLFFFFHNQPTTKGHVYHPWKNYSFYKDGQAQRSSTTRPS